LLSTTIIRAISSRRIRWVGHVAGMGVVRNEYKILVGKPGGKRSLKTQSRGEDSIKIDLKRKSGWVGV
jgi:hypothetical protein